MMAEFEWLIRSTSSLVDCPYDRNALLQPYKPPPSTMGSYADLTMTAVEWEVCNVLYG